MILLDASGPRDSSRAMKKMQARAVKIMLDVIETIIGFYLKGEEDHEYLIILCLLIGYA